VEIGFGGDHAMPRLPQYSLKGILVIITVLSVPLGMLVSRNERWEVLGVAVVFLVVGGLWGYITRGQKGVVIGVTIGLLGTLLFFFVFPLLERLAIE